MSVSVEIRPDADLTPEERALYDAWDARHFGGQRRLQGYTWAPAGWRALVFADGQPVSHLDITLREILHGEQRVSAAGIGTVMTPEPFRGHGYAELAIRRAQQFMFEELNVALGLLVCLPDLCPYYARLGWIELHAPLVFAQPSGQVIWPHAAMVLPHDPASWHDAPVDLCGLPW